MFKPFIDNKKLGGVTCLIWKDGQMIYRESQGYRNMDTLEPMTMDTLFRNASMTKPITSVLTTAGTPFVSFFSPEEILVLARKTEFKNAKTISTRDMELLNFSGRKDGLLPASGEIFLLVST